MKSKLVKDRYIIECSCRTPTHLLVFDFDKDEYEEGVFGKYPEISVYFTSNHILNFFGRLKVCFKYLFKKESFLIGDDVIINKNNIEELQEWIDYIRGN